MNILEYQAKKIFQSYGIPVLKGCVAYTPQEAGRCTTKVGGKRWAIKAQIHSNVRGQGSFLENEAGMGGGIRMVSSTKAAVDEAVKMLGKTLVTPLTGPKGEEVKKIYVEEYVDILLAFNLSIYIDFSVEKVFLLTEEISERPKRKRFEYELDLNKKMTAVKATAMATKLGIPKKHIAKTSKIIQVMYEIFKDYSAFRVELNPLVVTKDNRLFVLDGKIAFDPDAMSKFKEITNMRDLEEETPSQIKARLNNFRYVALDGNIGVIINGSGLGMATLDLMHLYGGEPSCILDLGGEPTKETVANAFKTILSEPNIEGVLINIFGGSSRCDVIAEGLIAASKEISIGMPLVVRMDGTNAQIGCRLLFESGLPFTVKQSMDEAVRVIIQSVQEIV